MINPNDPPQYQTPWSCQLLTPNNAPFLIRWDGNKNRVIDNAGAQVVNGNKLHLWGTNNSPAQKWIHTQCGQIQLFKTSKCIDNQAGRDVNGNQMQIWECDCNNKNQKFQLVNGKYKWLGGNGNKCIDINGGFQGDVNAVGTKIQIWDCMEGNVNQQFKEIALTGAQALDADSIKLEKLTEGMVTPRNEDVDWSNFASNNSTVTLMVPLKSKINFIGSMPGSNPVTHVCETAFATAGIVDVKLVCEMDMNMDMDNVVGTDLTSTTFEAIQEGTYFFQGKNGQKVQVIVTNAVSLASDADIATLNAEFSGSTPTAAPSSSKYILIGGIAGGVGGVALIAIVVIVIVRRNRNSAAASSRVELSKV